MERIGNPATADALALTVCRVKRGWKLNEALVDVVKVTKEPGAAQSAMLAIVIAACGLDALTDTLGASLADWEDSTPLKERVKTVEEALKNVS